MDRLLSIGTAVLTGLLGMALQWPAAATASPTADRASVPMTDPRCAEIVDDRERLVCYDALAAGEPPPAPRSFLERHWDLGDDSRLFRPWAHRPTYMLPARWTNDPNEAPFADPVTSPDVQSVEVKFQISFKTKLVENLFGGPGDLWFGYTQQSHFQLYNKSESRPFRETDFEPELLVVFPVRRSWGDWTLRVLGAGFLHQSNGRSEPLSRSWNRVYALAGIERGNVVFHIRPWVRIDSESPSDDDNPNIEKLIGRMELITQWAPGRQVFLFRGRTNLDAHGHKGSFEANWFFPIRHRLRGQFQVFSGYGESLIDYDHRQTTVGLGLLLFDPF